MKKFRTLLSALTVLALTTGIAMADPTGTVSPPAPTPNAVTLPLK